MTQTYVVSYDNVYRTTKEHHVLLPTFSIEEAERTFNNLRKNKWVSNVKISVQHD